MKTAAILGLVRPFTLLAPMVGALSGAAIAHAATDVAWRWGVVLVGLASALLATAPSNAWNQAVDVEIDRVNKPLRPVPQGIASARGALRFGHACALGALALGWLASPAFFVCVAVGVLATWIYSAPPLRTKRRPFAALLTIAVPRGLLVPVAGWSLLASPADAQPWILGAVVGLYVLGAAATKDFADVDGDRQHGCKTLPILLGPKRAARVVTPFLVFPFLGYPLAAHVGGLPVPLSGWWILAGVLVCVGLLASWRLVRSPATARSGSGQHPVWIAMYVMLLAAHVGSALVYLSAQVVP